MKKYSKNVSQKNKRPPGSIIHIGDKKRENVNISVFKYNVDHIEKTTLHLNNIDKFIIQNNFNYWIVVDGLHDSEIFQALQKKFSINNIVIENIVNTSLRPSIDIYKENSFIVTKEVAISPSKEISFEQISLIVAANYLITFTECKLDAYDIITNLLEESNFREKGISYLCYTILDFIVDNYFITMENIDDQLDVLEERILNFCTSQDLEKIYKIKKDLLLIQKSISPQRNIINMILRERGSIFNDNYDEYYRDIDDHIYQVKDMIDIFRDIISGILDVYLTSKSNKMNEIMKVLTIISTIFMPITFIVGIYGMNFKYMPELNSKYGYPAVMIFMVFIFITMLIFFKKKKWF